MHIIATAGHVDHGKSTLVRALTGVNPDRLKEEQRRGLTIELGFAFLTLASGRQVSFVDVPGHIRFIRNMLAGVGAVDAVMFVVSAAEGWKPQSAEHLAILNLLDVAAGIVVLTHADAFAGDSEGLELAQLDIAEHTAGTFLEHAPVIATNAPAGAGLDELRDALDQLTSTLATAADKQRPRLWIDRSFVMAGAGRVVTGTLTGGSLSVGETLLLAPSRTPGSAQVSVRSIQSQGREYDEIGPGQRVALNLTGASARVVDGQLQRGVAVVRPDQWHLTNTLDAQLTVLDSLSHEVSRRGAYVMYVGSGAWPVRLRVLGSAQLAPGQQSSGQQSSGQLAPGQTGNVRLYVKEALPLVAGDRFVLRELGRTETVGGGVILDVDPQLTAAVAAPDLNVDRVIAERGWTDVAVLEQLTGQRVAPQLGRWVAAEAALNELASEVSEAVAGAGPLGLAVAQLDERQRLALDLLSDVVVVDGMARASNQADVLADHRLIAELAAEPFAPVQDFSVPAAELAELARRGLIVKADGIWFAASAVELAAQHVARLLATKPDGVTMAEIRDALGTTRKFALPLVSCLDKTGVTRRRGDLRIAGARLPDVATGLAD